MIGWKSNDHHKLVIAMVVLFGPSLPASGDCLDHISWVVRPSGNYSGIEQPFADQKKLPLSSKTVKSQSHKLYDAQYGRPIDVAGYSLDALARAHNFDRFGDLALLHFANGMVIPYDFKNGRYQEQLRPFIACQYFESRGKHRKQVGFPSLSRPDPAYRDPRPIQFDSNKLVVASLDHPMHGSTNRSGFSPFRHCNSLQLIELVDRQSYYQQFAAKDPKLKAGETVFLHRCQFCHGLYKVGAQFGWDFVGPLPVHIKRQVDSLYNHIKYPKAQAFEWGTLMPHQKDITQDEVRDLWLWIKDRNDHKMLTPYQEPRPVK